MHRQKPWAAFLKDFEGLIQIHVPDKNVPSPIIMNMRRDN
jgi:hypothetical protein